MTGDLLFVILVLYPNGGTGVNIIIMKKNIIIVIIVVLAIISVGFAVKVSQNQNSGNVQEEEKNPASEMGEGEVRLTDQNFEAEIKNYKGVALVDFYLPICPYCKKVGPIISEIAKETQGKYKVGKIDSKENSKAVATLNNFKSVPALIFYKNGQEVDRLIGLQTKEDILKKLEEAKEK